MKQIQSFRIPYQKDPDLKSIVSRHLGLSPGDIGAIRVLKRSLDARNRRQFYWVYSLEIFLQGESVQAAFQPFPQLRWEGPPPLIIGSGPAGLFAAWTLLGHGIRPVLLERGERTYERMRKISLYWRKGRGGGEHRDESWEESKPSVRVLPPGRRVIFFRKPSAVVE